ncbi:MAG: alpha/beta family hydrolase [Hyphomicrobium sp.]
MTLFLNVGPPEALAHILLAHGAGAAMTSPFLEKMTVLLTERGMQISRFEFEYMAARRVGGKRRPPPRAEKLVGEYESAVAELREQGAGRQTLLIGGKSMGGRVASLAADELFSGGLIDGLVCLGYPFHPPGKPENLRTAHLQKMSCPALIVQGERDPFGGRGEVESYALSPNINIAWAGDGDHDLGPRGGSGFTRAANLALAADAIAAFAASVGKR